jgi:pantothenate kinase
VHIILKIQNSKGFDRILERILVDGIENIMKPLAYLVKIIYKQKKLPDQWLVAKTNSG